MRSTEFIKEGVDTSPEDIQQNHPEIYDFVSKITGPISLEKAKVNSFDLGDKHFVSLEMGPSAGLNNTRAVMKGKGIGFDNKSENELIGEYKDLRFTVRQDKIGPGNNREYWTFQMPKQVDEAVFEGGSNADEIIKNYNLENMMVGGSEANLTGPDTVTVTSLDDYEDMFIGSVADFEQWANGMSEGEELTDIRRLSGLDEAEESLQDLQNEYRSLERSDALGTASKLRALSNKIRNHPDHKKPDHSAAMANMDRDQNAKHREDAKFAMDKIRGIFK